MWGTTRGRWSNQTVSRQTALFNQLKCTVDLSLGQLGYLAHTHGLDRTERFKPLFMDTCLIECSICGQQRFLFITNTQNHAFVFQWLWEESKRYTDVFRKTFGVIKKGSNKLMFLLSKDALTWSKVTVKTFIMLQTIYFEICSSKNPEIKYLRFNKDIKQHNCFNINDNKCLSEWFLKDHVTLNTGAMMLKIQLCIAGQKSQFKI